MLYEKNGVQVDGTRYIVNGQTFPINGIAAVRASELKTGSIGGMIVGVIMVLVGIGVMSSSSIVGLIIILLGAGAIYGNKLGTEYSVKTTTSAGETDSYKSNDKTEISDIVNAINDAIISRG